MRILFILPDLPRSGAATRTVLLAEKLVDHGDDVVVATFLPTVDGHLAQRLCRSHIDVLHLRSSSDVRRLRGVLCDRGDTVIHAVMPTAGLLGLCLARAMSRPIVYSYTNCLHGHRPFGVRSTRDRLKMVLEQVMAGQCDALHAVSHPVSRQLRETYPQATRRNHAIVSAVTAPVSEDPRADSAELSDAHPRLLCMGRLLPHKRVDDAIRAVASIRMDCPGIILLIVGSGPDHGRLKRLASQLGVGANVRLIGESTSPACFLSWADVLVHPSLYEGYPRVFAEARAHGLPVVSIDTPYGREYADTGARVFLARPADGDSLARTIAKALVQGGTIPVTHDADASAQQMSGLYRRVIDERVQDC